MELVVFFGILTLASAICSRLINTNRQYWFSAYGVIAFVFFLGLLINLESFLQSFVILAVVSGIGFLGPEIWHATQNVIRTSRAVGIGVLVVVGVVLIYTFPEIAQQIISIGIIVGVLWVAISGNMRRNNTRAH